MVITHLLNGMILQVEDQGSDELIVSPAPIRPVQWCVLHGVSLHLISPICCWHYLHIGALEWNLVRFYMDFCLRGSNKGLEGPKMRSFKLYMFSVKQITTNHRGVSKRQYWFKLLPKNNLHLFVGNTFFFRRKPSPTKNTTVGQPGQHGHHQQGDSPKSKVCLHPRSLYSASADYEAWQRKIWSLKSCGFLLFFPSAVQTSWTICSFFGICIYIYIFGWSDLEKSMLRLLRVVTGTKDH